MTSAPTKFTMFVSKKIRDARYGHGYNDQTLWVSGPQTTPNDWTSGTLISLQSLEQRGFWIKNNKETTKKRNGNSTKTTLVEKLKLNSLAKRGLVASVVDSSPTAFSTRSKPQSSGWERPQRVLQVWVLQRLITVMGAIRKLWQINQQWTDYNISTAQGGGGSFQR